jgi:hypothetical protein
MWEFDLLNWINEFLHGSDFVNRVVHIFTLFGEGGVVWFGAAIVFLFIKKYRRLGITVILAMILIAGFNNYIFNLGYPSTAISRTERGWFSPVCNRNI